jgi:hypothetical protein
VVKGRFTNTPGGHAAPDPSRLVDYEDGTASINQSLRSGQAGHSGAHHKYVCDFLHASRKY